MIVVVAIMHQAFGDDKWSRHIKSTKITEQTKGKILQLFDEQYLESNDIPLLGGLSI